MVKVKCDTMNVAKITRAFVVAMVVMSHVVLIMVIVFDGIHIIMAKSSFIIKTWTFLNDTYKFLAAVVIAWLGIDGGLGEYANNVIGKLGKKK